jgi:hypothetical protein
MTKAKPFLKWGVGTLLVFGGILVGAWVMRETQVNRLWQAQRDEAKRLGISLNPDDYNKTDFPESQNAAPRYEAVILKLKNRERELNKLGTSMRGSKVVTDADLEKLVAPFRPEIPEILAATKLPHYRWKRPYDKGFELMMPEFTVLRNLGLLLASESRLAAKRGDKARATEYAIGAIRLGRHLRNEPMLIGQLVTEAVSMPAMWHGAKLMAFFDDPAVTKTLMAEINAVEPMKADGWIGTELITCDLIAKAPRDFPESVFDGGSEDDFVKYVFRIPIVRREGSALAMEATLELYRELQTTTDPQKWNEINERWSRRRQTAGSGSDLSAKFAQILSPGFPGNVYGRTEQTQRMIRLLFGSSEPAVDPRMGRPFRLKRTPKVIEIESEEARMGLGSSGSSPAQTMQIVREGRTLKRFVNGEPSRNWSLEP